MKSNKILIVLALAVLTSFAFVQCKKDESCKMKVTCWYSSDGVALDSIAPEASISFNTEKYQNGTVDSILTKYLSDTCTDMKGVFEYTFNNPAVFIIDATKVDTIKDDLDNVVDIIRYKGTVQLQVKEGELTEKNILLVKVAPFAPDPEP